MTAPDSAMPKDAYVYAITVDGTLVYIGKGRNGRAWRHEKEARWRNERRAAGKQVEKNLLYNKLGKALRDGAKIGVRIIKDGLSDREAYEIEKKLVGVIRELIELWNVAEGGCGVSSEHMKARWNDPSYQEFISNTMKGVWEDPDHRESRSAAIRRAMSDPAYRARRGEISKARWEDPSYRERVVGAIEARWQDPDFCEMASARISEAKKLKFQEPGSRDRLIAAWEDPEIHAHRSARISEGKKKLWQDPEHGPRLRAELDARWQDPEYKEKVRAGLRASWQDPEVKAKRMATHQDPNFRDRQRAIAKAKHQDPEYRARHKAQMADPEVRARLSAGKRAEWGRKRAEKEAAKAAADALGIPWSPKPGVGARSIVTPHGTFPSATAAAAAHGIAPQTAWKRAKYQRQGWYFADEEPKAQAVAA